MSSPQIRVFKGFKKNVMEVSDSIGLLSPQVTKEANLFLEKTGFWELMKKGKRVL